ncbi:hypothetical protein [Tardiphaga sp. 862_B3_N1_1]|uniref:hypothetical protein n=1 Tax=Tardiphaga sp. 862_B3_N1_1 TaxID=3240763 RepID=UPI003F8C9168
MPNFLLRKNSVVPAYPNTFLVILPLDDGYELVAGNIAEGSSAGTKTHWAWSCPSGNGRCGTRDEAMAAFRVAWANVADQTIRELRYQQEWTDCKYALFDAGYKSQIAQGAIRCPCGVTFAPRDHAALLAHIGHITAAKR